VYANRVLQDLRGMGLISLHGKTLRVLYLEKLKTVGEFDPTYLHPVKRAALWPRSRSSPGLRSQSGLESLHTGHRQRSVQVAAD
jgi:hypothetical protein